MAERTGLIAIKGNPLTLLGDEPRIGNPAPEFSALGNDLSPVELSSFLGKVVLISSVPSLDTAVCDVQTRRFNEEATRLGDQAAILTISVDLPFAQKRWCGAAGVSAATTLSDHRDTSFGLAYGVLIKELRLLARALFIVDADGVLRYSQLVGEVTNEPDYDEALAALGSLVC